MPKKAFITGTTGQDGAYLSRFLLDRGYDVSGLVRRSSTAEVSDTRLRSLEILNDLHLIDGDLTDLSSLIRIIRDVQPHEIYNLAAQSFVKSSWQQPFLTGHVTGLGCLHVLEAMRLVCPDASGSNLTIESRDGFRAGSRRASLGDANRHFSFHHGRRSRSASRSR